MPDQAHATEDVAEEPGEEINEPLLSIEPEPTMPEPVRQRVVVLAAAAITGTPWLLVVGLAGHGLKDLWQHRTQFVANTKWWPPFCLVVDFVVAAIIAVEIVAGVDFHH